jgi:hypothetical protein
MTWLTKTVEIDHLADALTEYSGMGWEIFTVLSIANSHAVIVARKVVAENVKRGKGRA